jgi:alanyl-tRNA synthetase
LNYAEETHVGSTGELGYFAITTETAVAAGVRRIEAVSGKTAEQFIAEELKQLDEVRNIFRNPKDLPKAIGNLQQEIADLKKHLDHMENRMLVGIRNELLQKDEIINNVSFVGQMVEVQNADALKKICIDLRNNLHDHLVVLTANIGGKPSVR